MLILIFLLFSEITAISLDCQVYPNLSNSFRTDEKIIYDGLPVLNYFVLTKDKYILEIFRIPNPGGKVILISSGLLGNSDTWVWDSINFIPLPYLLWFLGYDVFLMNFRGSSYGENHTSLNPNEGCNEYFGGFKGFWDFSFHELGMYDLADTIDFVLEKTNKKCLIYMGVSMGTTAGFVLLSEKPDYNNKICLFIALAPVVYLTPTTPLFKLSPLFNPLTQPIITEFGPCKFLEDEFWLLTLAKLVCACDEFLLVQHLCANIFFAVAGYDYKQLDEGMIPVYISNTGGASVKTIAHYAQMINTKKFQYFDYGYFWNLFYYYGSLTPPLYDLENVQTKTYLIYGNNDWIVSPTDVQKLFGELYKTFIIKENLNMTKINYHWWNHLDYLWAKVSYNLFFTLIFDILSKYDCSC